MPPRLSVTILRPGELQVSLLVIDETLFRILRGLVAASRNVPVKQVALGKELKQSPQLLASLTPNLKLAATYLTSWATLVGTSMDVDKVLQSWFDRCLDIGGFHDAYHLSLAEHSGARSFVTVDADFKSVARLPVAMNVITL